MEDIPSVSTREAGREAERTLSFIYINSLLGYVHHMGAGGDVS
jgi:hypothetical protein